MKAIYVSVNTVFIPTDKKVEEDYSNGKEGDDLWLQVYNGKATGNYLTHKEIMTLNPRSMRMDKLAKVLTPHTI